MIPALDTYPRCVTVAQTVHGKASLLAAFAVGLALLGNAGWWAIAAFLVLTTFLPRQRRVWLTLGSLSLLFFHTHWPKAAFIRDLATREQASDFLVSPTFQILGALVMLGLLGIVSHLAGEFRKSFPLKRPLLTLALCYFLLVLTASYAPVSGSGRVVLWMVVVFFGSYFWYFGFTLLDHNSKDPDPYYLQLGTYYPVWALRASPTPFVKGAAYLRKIEAKNPEELAVTQLKGLKLLYWVLVLDILNALFTRFVFGPENASSSLVVNRLLRSTGWELPVHLSVPTLGTAIARNAAGAPFAWYVCWVTLIASFLKSLLTASLFGHPIVACCRAAGFRALRSTYRPLESRTIADFFNRYYFYFKEMLVDFFFYPTYLRYFKRHPRLRLVVASLAAATLGNMMYHFMRDIEYVDQLGLWKALVGFRVYAFYTLVLGLGIAVSQIRDRRKSPHTPGWIRDRLWPSLRVGLFFCLLQVFDSTARTTPIRDHFLFLANLLPGLR